MSAAAEPYFPSSGNLAWLETGYWPAAERLTQSTEDTPGDGGEIAQKGVSSNPSTATVLELAAVLTPESCTDVSAPPASVAVTDGHRGPPDSMATTSPNQKGSSMEQRGHDGHGGNGAHNRAGVAGAVGAPRPGTNRTEPRKAWLRNFRHDADGNKEYEPPAKLLRAAVQLRQLLDFYFEPFNMQHNRYLLDLLARRLGQPAKVGPWPAESLLDFRFSFDDLSGLGRIASALAKLRASHCEAWRSQSEALGYLKHLMWTSLGQLQLRAPPEVRSFVAAKHAPPQAVSAASRYLSAVRERRGQAPPYLLSVVSYCVAASLADTSPFGQQRLSQLKRQLLLHHTDVVCLQGLHPEVGMGPALLATLLDDGYKFLWAESESGESNTILWDYTRLSPQSVNKVDAALAVDFHTFEESHKTLFKIVCMKPEVPVSIESKLAPLFGEHLKQDLPLVVCADLSLLGGAEAASVVEELAGLSSVSRLLTGDELAVPLSVTSADGSATPIHAPASYLNRLHRPDGMLFQGMDPLLALSGHTEHYMETMPLEAVVQQFPAFRVPLVAAFDWRTAIASASTNWTS